ncbi:hypothetical protein CY34DRAFT_527132 [Suillus luteus UH-Slu-Lm8-n1]|uniref:Unplaced genomic scaffold CY34scaffold_406, whole genome shotgun sequence n=1 Tax=Suillus luteus UH-Slu-Lm8-n1 TaxID=930992 RepID=A0A0D0APQ7_9AGAM|nr:hypothetical protein CY34DRAFT_527132 [Suillus luteus UH-Slu-Lm8-n1]
MMIFGTGAITDRKVGGDGQEDAIIPFQWAMNSPQIQIPRCNVVALASPDYTFYFQILAVRMMICAMSAKGRKTEAGLCHPKIHAPNAHSSISAKGYVKTIYPVRL